MTTLRITAPVLVALLTGCPSPIDSRQGKEAVPEANILVSPKPGAAFSPTRRAPPNRYEQLPNKQKSPPAKYVVYIEPLDLSSSVSGSPIRLVVPLRYDKFVAVDADKHLLTAASLRRISNNANIAIQVKKTLVVLDAEKRKYQMQYEIVPLEKLQGWFLLEVDLTNSWFVQPGKRTVRFSPQPYPMVAFLRICWGGVPTSVLASVAFSEAVSAVSAKEMLSLSQAGAPLKCLRQNKAYYDKEGPEKAFHYICPGSKAADVRVSLRETKDAYSGKTIHLKNSATVLDKVVSYDKPGCKDVSLGTFSPAN
ncbi:MAG: hypothetical protein KAI47_08480 [Deltaproteobacteria bacterium]|nr:hypothetical protein [Deltaproteobacteria bacterium]